MSKTVTLLYSLGADMRSEIPPKLGDTHEQVLSSQDTSTHLPLTSFFTQLLGKLLDTQGFCENCKVVVSFAPFSCVFVSRPLHLELQRRGHAQDYRLF